jgi:hypothetical protein
VNKLALMPIKIASEEAGLVAASAEVGLVVAIWVDLDVNLLKAY